MQIPNLAPGQTQVININHFPEVSLGPLYTSLRKGRYLLDDEDRVFVDAAIDEIYNFQIDTKSVATLMFKNFIAPTIQEHCSEAWSSFKQTKKLLYRGHDSVASTVDAILAYPRTDRTPLSTAPVIAEYYDLAYKAIGAKAMRSNSLFCTSNLHQAEGYGSQMYFVFPFNGFDYTWSPTISDAFESTMQRYFDKEILFSIIDIIKTMDNETYVSIFGPLTYPGGIKAPDIRKINAFKSRELLLTKLFKNHKAPGVSDRVTQLLKYISKFDKSLTDIRDWFIPPDKYAKKIRLTTTNFNEALSSSNEVMIKGQCMLINYVTYLPFVNSLLRNA